MTSLLHPPAHLARSLHLSERCDRASGYAVLRCGTPRSVLAGRGGERPPPGDAQLLRRPQIGCLDDGRGSRTPLHRQVEKLPVASPRDSGSVRPAGVTTIRFLPLVSVRAIMGKPSVSVAAELLVLAYHRSG